MVLDASRKFDFSWGNILIQILKLLVQIGINYSTINSLKYKIRTWGGQGNPPVSDFNL